MTLVLVVCVVDYAHRGRNHSLWLQDGRRYVNYSAMAAGLVGGELPVVVFYYPVMPDSPYLPANASGERCVISVLSFFF